MPLASSTWAAQRWGSDAIKQCVVADLSRTSARAPAICVASVEGARQTDSEWKSPNPFLGRRKRHGNFLASVHRFCARIRCSRARKLPWRLRLPRKGFGDFHSLSVCRAPSTLATQIAGARAEVRLRSATTHCLIASDPHRCAAQVLDARGISIYVESALGWHCVLWIVWDR